MINAVDVVAEARTWIGVPYQHQGRTRNGVDCLGLLVNLAQHFNVTHYDEFNYSRNPSGRHMRLMLEKHLHRILYYREYLLADILHMAISYQPQHVAIISGLNPTYVIHADSLIGRVVEHRLDADASYKVRGVYRIPGVQYG